jgi:hypothetical protein
MVLFKELGVASGIQMMTVPQWIPIRTTLASIYKRIVLVVVVFGSPLFRWHFSNAFEIVDVLSIYYSGVLPLVVNLVK